ncbi:MAG: succinylglutamate desuccinylase [Candidatus Puniceispirillales bacterium]
MVDKMLDYKNELPVELIAPDISAYKKSNTGIDYIHTFDSGKPGPHVFISAVVHGNEPCGAIALDWFLKKEEMPKSGKLSLGFMNVEAYLAFDPANPNRTRWVDEDFNRLWGPGVLDDRNRKQTSEFLRAREVKPIIAEVDFLLDIHSMQKPCIPLMMAGMEQKGLDLAKSVGMEMPIIIDTGHREGMRMRDFGEFSEPSSFKNALLVECGQHWEKSSEPIAIETMVRFIRNTNIMGKEFGLEYLSETIENSKIPSLKVGKIITIKTDKFKFEKDWQGFDCLKKGQIIGYDGEEVIEAPYDQTYLIMPSKRLFIGKTAVRLAYPV